jgi:hypothetical protein
VGYACTASYACTAWHTTRHGFGSKRRGRYQAVQIEPRSEVGSEMGVILLVLLLALLFGGLGFAVHALWIVAVVVFLAWLIGFGVARGEGTGGRARWYRW